MSNNEKYKSMRPHLDKFQILKQGRMNLLLEEIEARGSVPVNEFLGSIASAHGIRRPTGEEYLRDWIDAGCITVQRNIIYYVKKPQ
jgi:hypothetical protein